MIDDEWDEDGPVLHWDDQREREYFYCECDMPDPVDDEPWVPAECGNCGGRM